MTPSPLEELSIRAETNGALDHAWTLGEIFEKLTLVLASGDLISCRSCTALIMVPEIIDTCLATMPERNQT